MNSYARILAQYLKGRSFGKKSKIYRRLILLNKQKKSHQLIIIMLNPDKPYFENSVDTYQQASKKPADRQKKH